MTKWKVVCEPEGRNAHLPPEELPQGHPSAGTQVGQVQGRNSGGMVVFVAKGSAKQEVERVAFSRANSKNPEITFSEQLKSVLDRARESVKVLNESVSDGGML